MAPLSARRRMNARDVPQLPLGGPLTDVQAAARTPRGSPAPVAQASSRKESATNATPRPIVRGPQQGVATSLAQLSPEESQLVERAFNKHDKTKSGEVDTFEFYAMCETLELSVERDVAQKWLMGRNEAKGFSLDDFKQLYGRILAAQTPVVRTLSARTPVRYQEVTSTEESMRAAFNRFAACGSLSEDGLRQVLTALCFPDIHGDGFDRFVGEWLGLQGKADMDAINFHEFVACINLLITFCDNQRMT